MDIARHITMLALPVLLLGLPGCATEREPDLSEAPAPPTESAAPAPPVSSGSGSPGVALQALLDASNREPDQEDLPILDRLNEPQERTLQTRENRHDPARTDTFRTLVYEGLSLTYITAGEKTMLTEVEVTGEDYTSPEGLRIGSTRDEVVKAYGEPDRLRNGELLYEMNEAGGFRHVYLEDDRVTRLSWNFYVD